MGWLDRLFAWLGYYRADYVPIRLRVKNGAEAVSRGQRWENFYYEEGGLADMIEGLRRAYFEKVGATRPGDTDTLLVLGLADKIARELEREVQTIIETGKMRARDAEHVERVARVGR